MKIASPHNFLKAPAAVPVLKAKGMEPITP
jgi:hypothetical protein